MVQSVKIFRCVRLCLPLDSTTENKTQFSRFHFISFLLYSCLSTYEIFLITNVRFFVLFCFGCLTKFNSGLFPILFYILGVQSRRLDVLYSRIMFHPFHSGFVLNRFIILNSRVFICRHLYLFRISLLVVGELVSSRDDEILTYVTSHPFYFLFLYLRIFYIYLSLRTFYKTLYSYLDKGILFVFLSS